MDSGSRGRSPGHHRNATTEHLPEELLAHLACGRVDLERAYAVARNAVRRQRDRGRKLVGHRLVWVRGDVFDVSRLPATKESFAIVGRHVRCTVALRNDPYVALRHLLLRSIALPSGGFALRILDLHTSLGFSLPDGARQTAAFAFGPVAIGVGEYALVALPPESSDDERPHALPPIEVDPESALRNRMASIEESMSPYRVSARPRASASRLTLMPRAVMVGEPFPPSLDRLTRGGQWTLTLERGKCTATVTLSPEDLVRGVLIGRSEKCYSEELRRVTDVNTSRTHVLIVRESDGIHAYDLASTQGTFMHGLPSKRSRLTGGGSPLTLGRGDGAVRLVLQRTP